MKDAVRAILLLIVACSITSHSAEIDKDKIEKEVMVVLDEFMASFSAGDAERHPETYHFPHYRLARGTMSVWETKEDAIRAHVTIFEVLPDTGWHHSAWVHRRFVTIGENKVHVDTRFGRYREDGSEIGTYDSLYVLTKKDGRWAVKMRSSFL